MRYAFLAANLVGLVVGVQPLIVKFYRPASSASQQLAGAGLMMLPFVLALLTYFWPTHAAVKVGAIAANGIGIMIFGAVLLVAVAWSSDPLPVFLVAGALTACVLNLCLLIGWLPLRRPGGS